MSIAYRKEVTIFQAEHVWIGDIGVLINFIGVVRGNSSLRRERELGYTVVNKGCRMILFRPLRLLDR